MAELETARTSPGARATNDPEATEEPRRVELHHLLLVLLLVVASVLRFTALSSFPEVEADEGLWTNSTKNFLLFGDWFMDGRTHVFLSPLFHGLSLASFWLFGPSIESARLVSAAAGVGAVGCLYLLAVRVTGNRWLALVAAAVLGLDQWAVVLSRRALIEPLQLFLALAAAATIAGSGRARIIAGGCLFGLALLAKLNVAILGIVLASYLVLRAVWPAELRVDPRDPAAGEENAAARWRTGLVDAALFGVVALGLAGAVYGALYLADPARFLQAFRFEMEGAHFVAEGEPLFRVGRWGIVPVMAARSVLELVRETPLVFSFALVGAIIAVVERRPEARLFLPWVVLGIAFPLVQMFQPGRYFFFALPGLAALAALMMVRAGAGGRAPGRIALATVATFLLFSGAYTAMNFAANRGNSAQDVEAWARAHLEADARILVAGYYATNLPHRAFAHYHVAPAPDDLLPGIDTLEIDYVIWDEREWPPGSKAILEDHFEHVHSFGFGDVYRTSR